MRLVLKHESGRLAVVDYKSDEARAWKEWKQVCEDVPVGKFGWVEAAMYEGENDWMWLDRVSRQPHHVN